MMKILARPAHLNHISCNNYNYIKPPNHARPSRVLERRRRDQTPSSTKQKEAEQAALGQSPRA